MSSSKYIITHTLDVPVFARIRFPAWLQSLYNIAQKECATLDETGAFCLVALPTDWDTHVQNIINTAVAAVTAITAGVTTTIIKQDMHVKCQNVPYKVAKCVLLGLLYFDHKNWNPIWLK